MQYINPEIKISKFEVIHTSDTGTNSSAVYDAQITYANYQAKIAAKTSEVKNIIGYSQ